MQSVIGAAKNTLLFKPMYYFTIFNKKGIVLYEDGSAPLFINNVIQAINPKVPASTKRIRDDIMEYEIRGQIVYLSINRTKILEAKISQFENIVSQLKENKMIDKEKLEEMASQRSESTPEPRSCAKKGKLPKKDAKADELDYGEQPGAISSIMSEVKKVEFRRIFSLFSNKINVEDLRERMTEHLIEKNVDPSFGKIITDDIISDLESAGVRTVSEGEFKTRMASSLSKVIPSVDHKKFIESIKSHKSVYSICFVGVNGVGKSTSLAKVACLLIQNGLKVYIAACDTFRAGAIEQLKVHVERFKISGHEVGFYESGYSKDDASIAKFAISKAAKENYDVILIDTAGRMHNKEHLMQSLNKLIRINLPDQILFVGEALVGGDSLSHIKEFNRWIAEGNTGKKIDSILLTKIDTVDDKIGQVLNLSFSASAPILFLGTGQSNSDLIPMDPSVIGEILTS